MINDNIKKAGIWVRVSTGRQYEGDSPEIHEARAKAYAESKGWIVVEKYKLCVSGKSVFKHPETQRMLGDVENGRIEALIFSKLARLARNVKELIEISDFFHKYNADIISLAESIDTSTPSGRLLFHVIAALAQWEREEISERVYAGMLTRAKMGESTGGAPPFGYTWSNKKLVINEQESVIAKDIFEVFLECKKIRTTASILNKKGYRTRKGSLWSDTSVRRLLQSTTYKGMHYLNHTKSRGQGRGWDLKPEAEWALLEVEPIVKTEIWEEVNRILKANSMKSSRKRRSYLLSGFVHCTRCSKKMYGYAYGRSKGYYLCTSCREKIEIQELEHIIIENLGKYQFNPKDLIGLPEGSVKDLVKRKSILKNSLEDTNKKIDGLLELHHKKLINNVTFSERIGTLEERQIILMIEIPKIEEEISMLKIKEQSSIMVKQMKTISQIFPQLTSQEQRTIMEELLESVNVRGDHIDICFYFLPAFQENMDLLKNCNESMSLRVFHRPVS